MIATPPIQGRMLSKNAPAVKLPRPKAMKTAGPMQQSDPRNAAPSPPVSSQFRFLDFRSSIIVRIVNLAVRYKVKAFSQMT
ncbi:hypothetical protein VDG1235_3781 [Verrucomicrobiia bacterium DG1235]|nr:hypothetical protein VDG1235_3781 [Verrucomicrobiae bacterium DG1235]